MPAGVSAIRFRDGSGPAEGGVQRLDLPGHGRRHGNAGHGRQGRREDRAAEVDAEPGRRDVVVHADAGAHVRQPDQRGVDAGQDGLPGRIGVLFSSFLHVTSHSVSNSTGLNTPECDAGAIQWRGYFRPSAWRELSERTR